MKTEKKKYQEYQEEKRNNKSASDMIKKHFHVFIPYQKYPNFENTISDEAMIVFLK